MRFLTYIFISLAVLLVRLPLNAEDATQQAEAKQAGLELIPQSRKELSDIQFIAQGLFNAANFDRLEQLLSEARGKGDFDKLDRVYYGLGKPLQNTQAAHEFVISQALKWRQQKPDSVAARVALSGALMSHAWLLRGDGYANTIKPEVEPVMAKDFRVALEALSEVSAQRANYPEWYTEVLGVYQAVGQNRQSYDAIFEEGAKRFPTYWSLYQSKAVYLMERWYGRKGEWQAFATESANKLGGENGDLLYAYIYWDMRTYDIYYDDPLPRTGLDYARIRKGYEAMIRRTPDNYTRYSHLFQVAKDAGDKATMKEMMSKLGNKIDFGIWKSVEQYNQDKKVLARLTAIAGR